MAENTQHNGNGGPAPTRVTGAASRALVELLSARGIPANEVVVTQAERRGSGERAAWQVTALRGRDRATHRFPLELVDRVIAKGPCDEWYAEVSKLLGELGVAFPAVS